MMKVLPVRLSTSKPPRVSAAVTCYNYGRFLDQCINSILSQEDVDVDIVIVDDGSTDDSVTIAGGLAARDERVQLLVHEKNRGPIASVNEALSLARSEYVLKMDADDLLTPGSLARSVAVMEQFPQVSLVYGGVQVFHGDPPTVPSKAAQSWSVWAGNEWLGNRFRSGHNVIRQPEALIRRSALDIVGGHREDLPAASDFALWLRLAAVGSIGRVNGATQGLYRIHPNSLQRTVHAGLLFDFKERASAIESFFRECWERIDEPARSRDLARRTLARDALYLAQRSLDRGMQREDPVAEYLEIARRLDPGIVDTVRWHAIHLRSRAVDAGLDRLARCTPGMLYRELERRVSWHWEKAFGA